MPTADGGDGDLSRDVRAFAAQLGIGGAGHAFDEFGAQVAAKRVGPGEGGRPGKRKRGGAGGAEGQGGRGGRRNEARDNDGAKRVKKYRKPGMAPSEESRNFRSLLGPEEPPIWYEAAANLPSLKQPESDAPVHASDEDVSDKRQAAEEAMKQEAAAFCARLMKENYKDATWLEQVRRTGTTGDKIAALTISIRESAVANLEELDPLLLLMEKRKGTREMVARSMEALAELFSICLLPDRKLKFFKDQPVHLVSTDRNGRRQLLYWFLEDGLKVRYARFVSALESATMDRLEFLRDHATRNVLQLLSEKPEQEGRLLSALVNKLGDPKKKLASRVTYYIGKLLTQHPMMKEVVIREIERFTFKSGLSARATFYAVTCLSQMQLDKRQEKDGKLAVKLLGIYMSLFKMLMTGSIGHKADERRKADLKIENGGRRPRKNRRRREQNTQRFEEVDARLLSHIISGVSRAMGLVPAATANKVLDEHLEDLLRVVHVAPFGVGAQTLKLLFQVLPGRSTSGDRLYRAVYSRVVSSELPSSAKLPVFMSLLFTAMKDDPSLARTAAFAKRLLQAAGACDPHVACGCLVLLSEVIKIKPGLKSAILQPEEDDDADVEDFKDAEDEEDTDGEERSMDSDRSQCTSSAADSSGPESSCAEDEGVDQESSSGDEWNEGARDIAKLSSRDPPASTSLANGHGIHKRRSETQKTTPSAVEKKKGYDIAKREPLYCGADRCCWWELCVLASHGHPTVSRMARAIMSGGLAKYDGDPLQGLNLTAFLDKFLGNEAKAHAQGTIFRPMGGVQAGTGMARVGSSAFNNLAEQNVPEADIFFHKYYNAQSVKSRREKKRNERRAKKVRNKDGQAEDDVEEYVDDDDLFLVNDDEDESDDQDGDVDVNVEDLFDEDKYEERERKKKDAKKGVAAHIGDKDASDDYNYDDLEGAMEVEDVAGDSDLSVSDMDDMDELDDSLMCSGDEDAKNAENDGDSAAPNGLMAAEFPELGSSSDEGEVGHQLRTDKKHGTAKKKKGKAKSGAKGKSKGANVFAPAEEYEALTAGRR
eukprot:evm.model.scf_2095.2 EVM.evm.TU.scf_2095.2   scf_2095:4356-12404(-)